MRPNGVITLCTDFGVSDAYAGILKGVIRGIAPAASVIDLTHAVPPQAVAAGALLLRSAVPYFPNGTVHLAIVDPGVGSARRPVAVIADRGFLVGPDNGLLAPAAELMGIREVRLLDRPELFLHPVSQTFHGRDVFAPVAARLAAGLAPDALGPCLPGLQELALAQPRREQGAWRGEVVHVDHFGNLITNIPAAALSDFPAYGVSVSIAGMSIAALSASYSAVASGEVLAIVGSWGLLEIAVRDGSAAARFRAVPGTPVTMQASARP